MGKKMLIAGGVLTLLFAGFGAVELYLQQSRGYGLLDDLLNPSRYR